MSVDEGWEPIEVRTTGPDAGDDEGGELLHLAVATEPIIGPGLEADEEVDVTLPRLSRHLITLPDGHQVGVAVCGRGVPLVVVHGFSAEGILYAQTLSRLVDLGFKVIAIDTAGHGGTFGLPSNAQSMASYADLLARVLDHLGIREAVLVGHSMGGRLVTELAANEPRRAIAVILLDAIVGDTWDRMVTVSRVFPPILAGVGVTLVIDTLSTVPWFRDPRQAAKLGSLVSPTITRSRPPTVAPARHRSPRSCAAAAPGGCSSRCGRPRCRCSSSTATGTTPSRSPRRSPPPGGPGATSWSSAAPPTRGCSRTPRRSRRSCTPSCGAGWAPPSSRRSSPGAWTSMPPRTSWRRRSTRRGP